MTSMTTPDAAVTPAPDEPAPGPVDGNHGGVDTHGDTHHAAVISGIGRQLGDREFPTTPAGYRALLGWLLSFGPVDRVGVEGTGAYGAALARFLTAAGVHVVEVDRPDRKARRDQGKSDPLDAYAAARAVLARTATGTPKNRDDRVEAIRVLRVTRCSAVKSRTQAMNQLRGLLVTAPAELREQLRGLTAHELIAACARLRPAATGTTLAELTGEPVVHDTIKASLRRLARRHQHLSTEIIDTDADLAPLITVAAPKLLALHGVGTHIAAQLLITAGDNPARIRNESALAHLVGVAPIPASSGKTRGRHRLNRGGDRAANSAIYMIVITRMHYDQRTRDYVARRTAQGLTKKEIIRCLKRYVTREIFTALTP